jgi:hypothetical protein
LVVCATTGEITPTIATDVKTRENKDARYDFIGDYLYVRCFAEYMATPSASSANAIPIRT